MTTRNHWLPNLVADDWQPAADTLLEDGEDLAYTNPPTVVGADQPESTGSIQDQTRIKVYEGGEEEHNSVSWGDRDKDQLATWTLDAQAEGRNAPERMTSARKILVRILERHRIRPHDDWQRIEEIRVRQSQDYNDYQHVLVTLTLSERGKLRPAAVNREEATP